MKQEYKGMKPAIFFVSDTTVLHNENPRIEVIKDLKIVGDVKDLPVASVGDVYRGFIEGVKTCSACVDKPQEPKKVDWTKEDENNLLFVKRILEGKENPDFLTGDCKSSIIEWIESMKPKKKKEWDCEELHQAVFDWLYENGCRGWDKYGNIYLKGSDIDNLVRHFASEPHWKPSFEQMESLRNAVIRCKASSDCEHLPELHEDLLKLM